MRKILILFWCLVPLSMAAYHYGPGQKQLTIDDAKGILGKAEMHMAKAKEHLDADEQKKANDEFAEAIEFYDEAIQTLPSEKKQEIYKIRLAKAKALFYSQQNPKARTELESLLEDVTSEDAEKDEILVADTREALAASQYYMAWLMRLENLPRETWEPEVDRSRQNFRLLAEEAEANNMPDRAKKAKEDLESAVRLALVELEDLQGLPLPSQ